MVMSDTVAVMNNGKFEQIGTPQELYHNPKSSFVAQFVGNNNKLRVTLHQDERGNFLARYQNGQDFTLIGAFESPNRDDEYDLFIRPESLVINPDASQAHVNRMKVTVTSILFDGGNSRLLVRPEGTQDEVVVALPQTRQYDGIKPKDSIEIGWDVTKAICYRRRDWKLYDEE
jgi:spermidine/putrescine transport system ATP-binding protein